MTIAYPNAETLARSYKLTHHIIKLQAEGLTHEEALLQPPFRGNCFNWVLGHLLVGRNTALQLLGEPPLWTEHEISRYQTGSAPITGTEQALSLGHLLEDMDRSQQQIAAALERISAEELEAKIEFRQSQRPLSQALAGLHWHETYHTGQLELLRQLAGKDDAII